LDGRRLAPTVPTRPSARPEAEGTADGGTVDHVVLPLDDDHVRAVRGLVGGVIAATGLDGRAVRPEPHVTLLAYTGGDEAAVRGAVEALASAVAPFDVHAHGYGFFSGKEASELALHVPVVRTALLDALHRRLCAALTGAGAEVAAWCAPELWTPHVTLVDRGLHPDTLADAVAWLALRHHPSWQIPVDRLALTGGWSDRDRAGHVVHLQGTTSP
ncbi:MAG: 2'-5' RNA ligase family protein, partial [Acidimicrobiales bacterium]